MQEFIDAVNQYGVPTVVAVGMAYFIYFIWKFVTTEILPEIGKAKTTLIGLIDRVRMLDNDMIRLDQKINTIIELQEQQKRKATANKPTEEEPAETRSSYDFTCPECGGDVITHDGPKTKRCNVCYHEWV